MDNANSYAKIPKEKFQFVQKSNIGHDKKLETKPVGYFQDAFRRFCKNKGAVAGGIVILFLLLFAIIAPFFPSLRHFCTLPKKFAPRRRIRFRLFWFVSRRFQFNATV